MKVSKQARRGAKELFRICLKDGVLDENSAKAAVQAVLQARPRGWLPMLSHFKRLIQLDIQRRAAQIETAVPLAEDIQATGQANLLRLDGPGLNFTFSQNPALIGGMRVRVGSDVYDGTVQGRLAALQDSF
jgi:F-type H+-transporting ATPase subunit delta